MKKIISINLFIGLLAVALNFTACTSDFNAVDEVASSKETTSGLKAVNDSKADFVIAEIFPAGTKKATKDQQYNGGDQYFIIGNNSDQTLYADGLVILESTFANSKEMKYDPEIRNEALSVQAIMRIAGDGKKHPVPPGGTLVICDNAINHISDTTNSFDLSKADLEWFIDRRKENPKIQDKATDGKESLEEIFNYTKTIWLLNKQGNKTYAIGRIPANISKETYLKEYTYKYKFEYYDKKDKTNKWSKPIDTFKFPNEWIIDAVNLAPAEQHAWNLSPLDNGFTYIGNKSDVKEHYGKAVIRKKEVKDGRTTWKDRNDSKEDFDAAQTASFLAAKK